MKLRYIEIIGVVLAAIVIAVIIALTAPFPTLSAARFPLLLLASVLYSASLFLWSAVWVFLARRANTPPVGQASSPDSRDGGVYPDQDGAHLRYGRTFTISMASLIGILTPMNIGTDFLRSFYGKRYMGLPLELTAAASVVARTLKLHVTLLLVIFLPVGAISLQGNLLKTLIIPVAGVVFLLAILYSLRINFPGYLSKRLKISDISETIRIINSKLGLVEKCIIYLFFATGFALEWLSLHLCFLALNLKPTLSETFVLFVLLYFLSRTPFTPQGLGVVEVSGFVLLKTMAISTAQIGALLMIWDFLRIFVPIVLSLAFSFNLKR